MREALDHRMRIARPGARTDVKTQSDQLIDRFLVKNKVFMSKLTEIFLSFSHLRKELQFKEKYNSLQLHISSRKVQLHLFNRKVQLKHFFTSDLDLRNSQLTEI
jgi:hypothetical protein